MPTLTNDNPQPPAERGRNQFGLRALLIWVAFFAACLASWRWAGGLQGLAPLLIPTYTVAGMLLLGTLRLVRRATFGFMTSAVLSAGFALLALLIGLVVLANRHVI